MWVWKLSASVCICKDDRYLKCVVDDSKILYDEIKYVMDIVSTKMANTTAINVRSTVSIISHSRKVR